MTTPQAILLGIASAWLMHFDWLKEKDRVLDRVFALLFAITFFISAMFV